MSRISDLQQRFQAFAGRPGRVAFAPGRINLIGEHTDYSGGFVLAGEPRARNLDRRCASRRPQGSRALGRSACDRGVCAGHRAGSCDETLERLRRRRDLGFATGGLHTARRRSADRERCADGLGPELLRRAGGFRRLRDCSRSPMPRCRHSRSHSRASVRRTNSSAPVAASWINSPRPTASLAVRSCSTAPTTPGQTCAAAGDASLGRRQHDGSTLRRPWRIQRAPCRSGGAGRAHASPFPQRSRLADLSDAETNELMPGLSADARAQAAAYRQREPARA